MTEDTLYSRHDNATTLTMSGTFVTQVTLATRWAKSKRTLEGWRQRGIGPAFVKIGRSVRYQLDVIEAYEAANLRNGEQDGQP